jgi:lipid-A-disaccharide synthase
VNDKKDLLLFSNGPGEVSTWVIPIVEAIRARKDLAEAYRILLIIHPCPFGSGTEHYVGEHIDGVEHVIQPREYMKILLTGIGRKRYGFRRDGIIFSLGGDLMHPVLFRRRIHGHHTLYGYSHNTGWERFYRTIFVRNEYVKNKYLTRGVQDDKIMIVGDLVYSSLKMLNTREQVRQELGVGENERLVVFLPGSRDYMTKYVIPVFLQVIDELTERIDGIRPFFMKSPYISYDLVEEGLRLGGKIREVGSIPGVLCRAGDRYEIEYAGGKRVGILEGELERWGSGIDFAVSLPGTNTIQLAYRGVPALVITAANKPEIVPIEGAVGMLKWVPLLGKRILKRVVFVYEKRYPYKALPNIYTNSEIFPEMFGILQPHDITTRIEEILRGDDLEGIRAKLEGFKLPVNPVDTIIDEVWGPPPRRAAP